MTMKKKLVGFRRMAEISSNDLTQYGKPIRVEYYSPYYANILRFDINIHVSADMPNGRLWVISWDDTVPELFWTISHETPGAVDWLIDAASEYGGTIPGDKWFDMNADGAPYEYLLNELEYETCKLEEFAKIFNNRHIVYEIEAYEKSDCVCWSIYEEDTGVEVAQGNVGYDYLWDLAYDEAHDYAKANGMDLE